MRRYSDRSAKLSQKPEIAALRSKAQEAQKAYQEALDAALAKEDPLLSAQHKAVREEMMKGIRNSRSRNLSSQRTTPSAYGQLSTEEKKQLDTARRGAMQSPKVREAREKRNQAKTEEDRSAAVAAYREELYKRMIAIDKEVEEILKKLEN